MINENTTFEHAHSHSHCEHKRISWSAIVVGALITVGLSFLMNLFGLAIGMSTYTVGDTGAKTLAVGGVIGAFVSVIVAMTAAGYASGYLGRHCCPRRNLGIVYGFATWSLALLLAAAVASPVAQYASSYSQKVTGSSLDLPFSVNHHSWSPDPQSDRPVNPEVVPVAKVLTSGTFVLFLLFLVGGIFSCVGACWGMGCKRED